MELLEFGTEQDLAELQVQQLQLTISKQRWIYAVTVVTFFLITVGLICGFILTRPSSTTVTTASPVTRSYLPINPTYGGKSGYPGAILRLAKNLFIINVEDACHEAEKKKPSNRSFGDVISPVTNGQLNISQLQLTTLTLPISLDGLQSPSDLCWFIKEGHLAASGLWTYSENVGNKTVNSTGFVHVPPIHYPLISFNAELTTTMGRNSDHQPTVTKVACRVRLDNLKIYFSSPNAPSATVGIGSNLTETIKEILETSICDLISGVVQMSLNNFLATFRTKIQLWNEPKITLDYSLLTDPFVDTVYSSVNALLKGSIYVDGAKALTIHPHEMPFVTNITEQSIAILFSDYILNSLLTSAYRANPFRLMTVNNTFSKVIANYLKMKCNSDELCVGSIFPAVSIYSHSSHAEISLSISQFPSATFLESGAYLQLTGDLLLDMKTPGPYADLNKYASPFSLVAALTPNVRSDDSKNVIFASAKFDNFHLGNDESLFSRRKLLMTLILQEIINNLLHEGIPLPIKSKIIRNHEFHFFNRSVLLSYDFI